MTQWLLSKLCGHMILFPKTLRDVTLDFSLILIYAYEEQRNKTISINCTKRQPFPCILKGK